MFKFALYNYHPKIVHCIFLELLALNGLITVDLDLDLA